MKIKKINMYIGTVLVLIIVFFAFKALPSENYDALAQCMTEKGTVMYGAFWCPHCEAQKEEFGSSYQYVTYIECSTPDGRSQTPACQEAQIESYPTWEFPDGSRQSGRLSFEKLAAKSGCIL